VSDLAAVGAGSIAGIVFFGSRRSGAARADAHSAWDLFVVVHGYRRFYRALAAAGKTAKKAWLMAALNHVLPPNQLSLRLGPASLHAKCAVVSLRRFRRETGPRRSDHFCAGRLCQPASIVHADSEPSREALLDSLVQAHAETWTWTRPWLPAAFDAGTFAQRALTVSLGAEIRPEPGGRAEALWAAQRAEQTPVYTALLDERVAGGDLAGPEPAGEPQPVAPDGTPVRSSPTYRMLRPVGGWERAAVRAYFTWSMVRATLRWTKHVLTFEGWLDYILRKVRRHGGGEIVLTERERRHPLLFLWPRVIRFLRDKDRSGRAAGSPGGRP
jgi:hypothetical protein